MQAKFLMILGVLIFAPLVNAAKLYKTVDENGHVTFSQVPPRNDGESKAKVEQLNVNSGAMSLVTTQYGKEHCGDIQLPSKTDRNSSSSKYFVRNVSNSLEHWKELLSEISQNVEHRNLSKIESNRYTRNVDYENENAARYQEEQSRDTARMRDLRCAINWAESMQDKITEYEVADSEEKRRLISIEKKLEQDLYERCGEQPVFDPSSKTNEYDRKRWYDCSKSIIRNSQKVRNRIDHL